LEEKIKQTDILETVRGAPSQQKAIKEEEIKIKAQEEPSKLLAQKLYNSKRIYLINILFLVIINIRNT
jgi:hypothetical protein